jgi:hypothetical protein
MVKAQDVPLVLGRLAETYGNRDEILQHISGLSPEWQEWFFSVYLEDKKALPPPRSSSLTYCFNADDDVAASLHLSNAEWSLFLHPRQREIVEDKQSSAIVVKGGPGTGKTVVLLSRLLKPTADPQKVRVLLTYSQRLVKAYREILETDKIETSGRIFIENANELVGKFRGSAHAFTLDVDSGRLIRRDLRRNESIEVEELLIDEFQDCDPQTIRFVQKLINCGARVTIGVDVGQTIFRANSSLVKSTIERADKIMNLTLEVKESVYSAFRSLGDEAVPSVYALSGTPVVVLQAEDLKDQIHICDRIFADLEKRFDPSELALIYLQYPNPAFKGESREEAALKNHPRLKNYYWFASLTKGREFWAGVVFASSTFLDKDMGPQASALCANTLYVAMSRFRDELAVVYPRECPLAPALRNFAHIQI